MLSHQIFASLGAHDSQAFAGHIFSTLPEEARLGTSLAESDFRRNQSIGNQKVEAEEQSRLLIDRARKNKGPAPFGVEPSLQSDEEDGHRAF